MHAVKPQKPRLPRIPLPSPYKVGIVLDSVGLHGERLTIVDRKSGGEAVAEMSAPEMEELTSVASRCLKLIQG